MKRILELVLRNGARPAEAGEFTKRAFLNGRMDLSQAEAVIDLINSKNDFAMKSAVRQLSGKLSEKIRQLREKILYETAFIESALDDPEHYSTEGYSQKLSAVMDELLLEIKMMISSADNGRMLSEGIRTVILGKAERRQIFSAQSAGGRGQGYRYRNRRNNQRYAGRADSAGWYWTSYRRYGRYQRYGGYGGKDRCRKGCTAGRGSRSDPLCGGFICGAG